MSGSARHSQNVSDWIRRFGTDATFSVGLRRRHLPQFILRNRGDSPDIETQALAAGIGVPAQCRLIASLLPVDHIFHGKAR